MYTKEAQMQMDQNPILSEVYRLCLEAGYDRSRQEFKSALRIFGLCHDPYMRTFDSLREDMIPMIVQRIMRFTRLHQICREKGFRGSIHDMQGELVVYILKGFRGGINMPDVTDEMLTDLADEVVESTNETEHLLSRMGSMENPEFRESVVNRRRTGT